MRQLIARSVCASALTLFAGVAAQAHAQTVDGAGRQAHTGGSPASESTAGPRAPSDEQILEQPEPWTVEEVRFRTTVYTQEGNNGYQSQAGPVHGPGSEDALIVQPSGLVTLRQSPKVTHTVIMPVDIVSAASANALDALSSASAVNEAATIQVQTNVEMSEHYEFESRLGMHFEEPFRGAVTGLSLERSLADDNATIGLSVSTLFDTVNNNLPHGGRRGERIRTTSSVDLSFSQILSPTTIALVGLGFTYQRGALENPWNSVPLSGGLDGPGRRGGERFPDSRRRWAGSLELAQHFPVSRSTLRGHYRYYADDFDVRAHTGEVTYFQYVGAQWLARASYRFHTQTAVEFFGTSFPQTVEESAFDNDTVYDLRWIPAIFQTSDSDLDAFDANEAGVSLSWFDDSGNAVDVAYHYYLRSNGLSVSVLSLGYSASF